MQGERYISWPRRRRRLRSAPSGLIAVLLLTAAGATADVVIDMPAPPAVRLGIAAPPPSALTAPDATMTPVPAATQDAALTAGSLALDRYAGARQQPRVHYGDGYWFPKRYWNRPYWYGPYGYFGVLRSRWFVHWPIIKPCR